MATGVLGTVARTLSFEAVHYLQFTINFNDAGVASGVAIPQPYLPAGASILFTNVFVGTAFNAGTTNTLQVGTTLGGSQIVATGDVNATLAPKGTMVLRGMDLGKLAADTQLFYQYNQTGGAATAGKAYVSIAYIIDIDINRGT